MKTYNWYDPCLDILASRISVRLLWFPCWISVVAMNLFLAVIVTAPNQSVRSIKLASVFECFLFYQPLVSVTSFYLFSFRLRSQNGSVMTCGYKRSCVWVSLSVAASRMRIVNLMFEMILRSFALQIRTEKNTAWLWNVFDCMICWPVGMHSASVKTPHVPYFLDDRINQDTFHFNVVYWIN